ncbi:HvfC/BufC N-terminal domain-containing protein [Pseudovibrio sp. Alg231-02]|uniref:HvfC/BufC N-terminal domain-containing protein n=1 Tax=Pseudovibrio sp. Alg231-02 TaxID=1922223 RepID=UPI000D5576AD|nr:DNA-binding domain-containing protein [Pseudovibrio sp. Alg231-02]
MKESCLKNDSQLRQLQYWLQEVLINRGNLYQKLLGAEHQANLTLEETIKETELFPAIERINIYASGYIARLVEALKAEYPLLCKFMGVEVFEGFAKAYIVTHPSRYSSLYKLGAKFPEFLEETQPKGANCPDQVALFQIPAELALYERTQAEVLLDHGLEEHPHYTSETSIAFLTTIHSETLQTSPCLRVLKMEYPIRSLAISLRLNDTVTTPQRAKNWVALTRKDYKVVSLQICDWQAELLEALKSPTPLYRALENVKFSNMAEVLLWLPTALDFGLVYYPK